MAALSFQSTIELPVNDAGAKKEDISASIFQAVVNQTISGLACGRRIKGNVAFLGGPLNYLPELRNRFIETLKLKDDQIIIPENAHLFVANGAALASLESTVISGDELKEKTIRDITTFSIFYFLGDYAAKGIATYLEKHNKDGIKLINRLHKNDGKNIIQKFWNWARHTKMKSTDELMALTDEAMRTKAKNLRALCQFGNLAFSLISLGVFIPIYTRTQTNKKQKMEVQNASTSRTTPNTSGTFTQNLIKNDSPTFQSFFS